MLRPYPNQSRKSLPGNRGQLCGVQHQHTNNGWCSIRSGAPNDVGAQHAALPITIAQITTRKPGTVMWGAASTNEQRVVQHPQIGRGAACCAPTSIVRPDRARSEVYADFLLGR